MAHVLDRILLGTAGRTHRLTDYLSLLRQRQALGRLDAHLLRDIGLDGEDAREEADRPVWDVPQHWKR